MTIDAVHLTKQYRDVRAVDEVTLRVAPGEIYALLGLNGAGKTTTIRMLLGLLRPTRGEVSLFGERVRPGHNAGWARVGYLVETPAAYPELTVTENLQVIAQLRGLRDEHAVTDAIARLGLRPHAHRRAQTLSLGNKQRLALAKALLHRPELLILDEPANGLDPAGVAEIRNLLHDLAHHDGVTILLSSHILTEVARLATRIGVLDHGRLVWEGAAADLAGRSRPRLRVEVHDSGRATAVLRAAGHAVSDEEGGLALTGDRAIHHPEEIATQLVTAGCPPTRLAVEQDDLETCFLRLVGRS
ncbi:ABC-2 type transport system ATP-binding protein [Amycolatopsis lexingtonensis]|uniref:ABC-2 type transport system ATP-binding protein n=1 Tax=Amycolatopsis lexingtonensis TaxID=218822 RepID=A0ABR9HXZ2_9PSEU|nr:ABC transporter ATP-binding protein [Amycolatopsis lexingtonensis]MBE1495798.1 ABC-2 type transport system ATP-binding protein [Amycolatopsis lexingtonensis]